MKKYSGFIVGFYPVLSKFRNSDMPVNQTWYAAIQDAEADDVSIRFEFNCQGDSYRARAKKIKENTFQGNFLHDREEENKSSDFIYLTQEVYTEGVILRGSRKYTSDDDDCIVILREVTGSNV